MITSTEDANKRARFNDLAEYPNISTGRQFAARRRTVEPILDQPIIRAEQQHRKSRSYALHAKTWFRVVATLADGKKITLRRRAMNAYSYVALYARPGVDNHPEAYLWRLTNGSAQKAFNAGPHNDRWWLLELIPIDLKQRS
jgi:hypothetical protein